MSIHCAALLETLHAWVANLESSWTSCCPRWRTYSTSLAPLHGRVANGFDDGGIAVHQSSGPPAQGVPAGARARTGWAEK